MTEDEKRRAGVLFFPGDPELKEIKRRTHNLNLDYNATYEDEVEKRAAILAEILGDLGEGETYRISVGNGVWIGAHATVLNNIGIGDGSVIAACACVRRDVPADTMVAGVPARVIKELEDLATDAQKE